MEELSAILSNKSLVISIFAWFCAQILKLVASLIQDKKVDWSLLLATGGFPSSHAAIVSALTTSIGINFGFDSSLFAVSIIMASVVMTDARGIRQAAGKQAKILNKIIEDLYQKKGLKMERLKELLGHTSLEVFCGALLGILIAVLFNI